MKLKFSLRTVFLGVTAFAVVAAAQASLTVNVSSLELKAKENAAGFSDTLMLDAKLDKSRCFSGMGGGMGRTEPAIIKIEPTLTDYILFRRRTTVAFQSSEMNGVDSHTFDHANTYLITPFGLSLVGSEEEWTISFHL